MKAALLSLALLLTPTCALSQDRAPAGDWDGVLVAGATRLRLTLHFGADVTLDSPDRGAFGAPATLKRDGDHLTITLGSGTAMMEGALSSDGQTLTTQFSQAGMVYPVVFTHRAPGALAPQAVATVLGPNEREVSIDGGKAPLYGTLLSPPGAKPGPAVLILAGSGPTDRDGNSTEPGVTPATYRLIARALAASGIPTLRVDKRAIGKSGAAATSEADLRLSTYVDDAVAWGNYLKTQAGVTCVVVLGHSEGALIGTLAAEQIPACGFISVSGAGRTFGTVLRAQLVAGGLAGDDLQSVDAVLGQFEQGHTLPGIPQTNALFRPSVQPLLISEMAVNPPAELKKVPCPVLIVQGDNDLQMSVEDAQLLAAARPDAKLVILPGANHVLKLAPADRAGNTAAYADPALPLAPGLVDAIVSFVGGLGPK